MQSGQAFAVGFGGAVLLVFVEMVVVVVDDVLVLVFVDGVLVLLVVGNGTGEGVEHVWGIMTPSPGVGTQTLTSVVKPFWHAI